jgi:hypothetical protein
MTMSADGWRRDLSYDLMWEPRWSSWRLPAPLWFWDETAQPRVLFDCGMRHGINVAFYRDVGWCRIDAYAEIVGK